jgi:hypothetical protein
MLVDEHTHESARVEAHENEEKGGVDEGMRISHELHKVNDILGILMKIAYRSETSYCKYTAKKVRPPHATGQRLMARTE